MPLGNLSGEDFSVGRESQKNVPLLPSQSKSSEYVCTSLFIVHIRRLEFRGGSHSWMGNEFFKWSLCVDPFPMMETMAFFKFECGTTNIEDWSWASLGGSTELICRAARQLTPGSFHKLWACCSHNWLPFLRARPIGHSLSWASHKNGSSMAFSYSHWSLREKFLRAWSFPSTCYMLHSGHENVGLKLCSRLSGG